MMYLRLGTRMVKYSGLCVVSIDGSARRKELDAADVSQKYISQLTHAWRLKVWRLTKLG